MAQRTTSSRALVEVLLELALVVAGVAYSSSGSAFEPTQVHDASAREWLTRDLLFAVARDGADDSVLLAADAVRGALDVALGLGGLVLGLALGVLLLARLGPGFGAGQVADGLDGGALEGVELASGLAVQTLDVSTEPGHPRSTDEREKWDAYLGSPLLEDMMVKELYGV